jgi:hypothetical protein
MPEILLFSSTIIFLRLRSACVKTILWFTPCDFEILIRASSSSKRSDVRHWLNSVSLWNISSSRWESVIRQSKTPRPSELHIRVSEPMSFGICRNSVRYFSRSCLATSICWSVIVYSIQPMHCPGTPVMRRYDEPKCSIASSPLGAGICVYVSIIRSD